MWHPCDGVYNWVATVRLVCSYMFKWQLKLFPSRSFYIVGELNFADAHLGLPTGAVFFAVCWFGSNALEFTKVLPPAALWTQSNRGAFSKCPLVEVELDKYYRCWSWIVNNSHTTYHTVIKTHRGRKTVQLWVVPRSSWTRALENSWNFPAAGWSKSQPCWMSCWM